MSPLSTSSSTTTTTTTTMNKHQPVGTDFTCKLFDHDGKVPQTGWHGVGNTTSPITHIYTHARTHTRTHMHPFLFFSEWADSLRYQSSGCIGRFCDSKNASTTGMPSHCITVHIVSTGSVWSKSQQHHWRLVWVPWSVMEVHCDPRTPVVFPCTIDDFLNTALEVTETSLGWQLYLVSVPQEWLHILNKIFIAWI